MHSSPPSVTPRSRSGSALQGVWQVREAWVMPEHAADIYLVGEESFGEWSYVSDVKDTVLFRNDRISPCDVEGRTPRDCASVDPETSCWFDPFFLGILSSEGERLTWEVKANGEVILFILELNYLY